MGAGRQRAPRAVRSPPVNGGSRGTSPGGRVFAFVLAAVLLPMTLGGWFVTADALGDGSVTIRLRGGGRLSPSGWRAYLYGAAAAAATLSFLSFGVAFASVALLPSRLLRHVPPLLGAGAVAWGVCAG